MNAWKEYSNIVFYLPHIPLIKYDNTKSFFTMDNQFLLSIRLKTMGQQRNNLSMDLFFSSESWMMLVMNVWET